MNGKDSPASGWEKVIAWCDAILRLAWINLLWLGGIAAGLGVFGFFPATGAMFAVLRRGVTGQGGEPVFPLFLREYRRHFLRLNSLGALWVLMGAALVLDARLLPSVEGGLSLLLGFLFTGVMVVTAVAFLYFFPVFAHVELRPWQYLLQPFLFALARPGEGLLMLAGTFLLAGGLGAVPGLLPFFGGSSFAWLWTLLARRAFRTAERGRRSPAGEGEGA